jgi:hypothetical protein
LLWLRRSRVGRFRRSRGSRRGWRRRGWLPGPRPGRRCLWRRGAGRLRVAVRAERGERVTELLHLGEQLFEPRLNVMSDAIEQSALLSLNVVVGRAILPRLLARVLVSAQGPNANASASAPRITQLPWLPAVTAPGQQPLVSSRDCSSELPTVVQTKGAVADGSGGPEAFFPIGACSGARLAPGAEAWRRRAR